MLRYDSISFCKVRIWRLFSFCTFLIRPTKTWPVIAVEVYNTFQKNWSILHLYSFEKPENSQLGQERTLKDNFFCCCPILKVFNYFLTLLSGKTLFRAAINSSHKELAIRSKQQPLYHHKEYRCWKTFNNFFTRGLHQTIWFLLHWSTLLTLNNSKRNIIFFRRT